MMKISKKCLWLSNFARYSFGKSASFDAHSVANIHKESHEAAHHDDHHH